MHSEWMLLLIVSLYNSVLMFVNVLIDLLFAQLLLDDGHVLLASRKASGPCFHAVLQVTFLPY